MIFVLWLHIRRSKTKWGAVCGFALGAYVATVGVWPGLSVWANASQAVTSTVLLTGPLLAGFAAWDGMDARKSWAGSDWRLACDGGVRGCLIAIAAPIITALTSYAAVAALIFVQMLPKSTWGAPNWSWVMSAGFSLIAQVSIGFFVGVVIPLALVPAMVAVLMFVINGALLVAGGASRLSFLSPGYTQEQEVAFATNPTILWAQATWYFGVAIVACGLLLVYGVRRRRSLLVLLAGAVAAVVGVVGIFGNAHGFYDFGKREWTFSCSEGTVKVCVHPAYIAVRGQIAAELAPVITRISQTPFGSDRYEMTNRGYLGNPSPGARAFHLDRMGDGWGETMRVEFARDLLTPGSGSGGPCENYTKDENSRSSFQPTAYLVAWLAGVESSSLRLDDSERAAVSHFQDRTPAEKSAWIRKNVETICDGTLTFEDF